MAVSKLTVSARAAGVRMCPWNFHFTSTLNTMKTEVHLDESKNSVTTSQRTHRISITKKKWLRLFRETVAICCKNHMKHEYAVRQNAAILEVKAGSRYVY
jgi:hypothetical protein